MPFPGPPTSRNKGRSVARGTERRRKDFTVSEKTLQRGRITHAPRPSLSVSHKHARSDEFISLRIRQTAPRIRDEKALISETTCSSTCVSPIDFSRAFSISRGKRALLSLSRLGILQADSIWAIEAISSILTFSSSHREIYRSSKLITSIDVNFREKRIDKEG